MSTIASSSIKATIKPAANNQEYELDIAGRGTSVLGSNKQGDHVTAYSLVEEGLRRALSGLSRAEVDELFELGNRDSLRGKRNKLYDFISAIAVLDPDSTKATKKKAGVLYSDKLFDDIDGILRKYNDKRTRKTKLREDTRTFQDDLTLVDGNLSAALGNIEQSYNKNGEYIRETFTEIAGAILTFYNHIPGTSYFAIPGFAAEKDEGGLVRAAKPILEAAINTCKTLDNSNVGGRIIKQRQLDTIVTSIAGLMHYPEITDANILYQHQLDTQNYGAKRRPSLYRENSENNLVISLARHMHIVFASYPELNTLFTKDEIVKPFISKMINGKEPGKILWPTFNRQADIDRISGSVVTTLNQLNMYLDGRKYNARNSYQYLESSDDEDEPTKPRIKVKQEVPREEPALVKTDTQAELEELRRLKEFFQQGINSGSIILSSGCKQELKEKFPTITPAREPGFI